MSAAAVAPSPLSKLLSRQEVAERTLALRFERPSHWSFQAGQYLDMTLIDPKQTDGEGNTRTFSIASSPHEASLMIATRLRDSAFKRTLQSLRVGTSVHLTGPAGDLTLDGASPRPAVLLAGGIGITPFRSMVLRAAEEELPRRIFLFYSNRRPEDAPFLEELQALERENPNYKLIATMTGMAKSQRRWNGETGKIDRAMLSRYLRNAVAPLYYVAGPPQMVQALHTMLSQAGIREDDIRAEEFAGY
ncbi:ferredoxin--NADP reductase [Paludibaculum fermentans]|uniref:FAD-dependent oxidoreductase n=1 Tax=Paludibaculum fermentans TaxID=1473598 RepID=A0A7S7NWK6_PALFE|nr:FAD-dependent oxidoreductase [Paludibaculum fermentans]QOY90524.1 FAD-dependent oxidoreductase [Paludibaculum fermentans]